LSGAWHPMERRLTTIERAMPTTVRSFSKINLGLAIGASRPDGFHTLTTLYQTLDAHDLITVAAEPAVSTHIAVTSNDERVPTDHRNTAWKAVDLAVKALGIAAQIAIHIDKRLPVQGGLGAGSGNAVAALIGLEHELRKHGIAPLAATERFRIAAEIGSDVPLFLVGGAVLGTGHGEEVYPLPDLPVTYCVLALPDVGISTPQAFRDWDAVHSVGRIERNAARDMLPPSASWNMPARANAATESVGALTEARPSDKINVLSRSLAAALCEPHSSGVFTLDEGLAETSGFPADSYAGTTNPLLALVRTGIENDFEEVVFPKYPQLGEIKRVLAASDVPEQAAIYASLSGSGSALFGLYGTAEAAESAVVRIEERGVRSLLTKTLPRDQYWRSMLL
jgi:4-diphosphocytidyl-2-C-methyl-D-erythritol kinase